RAKYNLRHINILADYFDLSPRDFLPEKPLPHFYPGREKKVIQTSNAVTKKTKAISRTKKIKKKFKK
ncbi:MAG TPA: hypothetical protein VK787_09730, partial [Puia sp.]|nr:hypothetical protein [Puia sp.]